MKDHKKCKAQVPSAGGWHWHRCENRAVTEVGYCRIHDPEERRARAEKRGPTKLEQEWNREEKARERRVAIEQCLRESTALLESFHRCGCADTSQGNCKMARQIIANEKALEE